MMLSCIVRFLQLFSLSDCPAWPFTTDGMGFNSRTVRTLGSLNEEGFASNDIIIRDVCILGGGSTGTYAAIRLKDNGKSIIVVEQNEVLGGHTETLYLDANRHVDYGVEGVFNNELSRTYLQRLGVEPQLRLASTPMTDYVDFKTGKKVPPPSGTLSPIEAATLYRAAIGNYSYLKDGLYNLPDPVPEELLQPFGEFVKKTGIQGTLQLVKAFAHGVGNILEAPLLRILQFFSIPQIDILLQGGYITPRNGMYELYKKASEVLGSDVLYRTTINRTERSNSGVKVVVHSANGDRKLIMAKQLLLTFVPIRESLEGFDLSTTESSLFEKWDWVNYYVAVVKNTGIPNAVTVMNTDPRNTPGALPLPPFQLALQFSGVDGYFTSKVVGNTSLTEQQAKEIVLSDIRRMASAGTYVGGHPEIAVFGHHTPTTVSVSNADIQDGFYKRVYALQGTLNTFYTGLAFCSDYSSLLWAYTDTVVQKMLSS